MTRFSWAAWGLLVVVLWLPFHGWDVMIDVVGYVWLVIGLAGGAALHPAFARARAAAVVGVPIGVITSTPLTDSLSGIEWGGAFIAVVVVVTVMHQLATGIRDLDPVKGDSDHRRWASGIRIAAPVAGAIQLVGIVGVNTALAPLWFLGFLLTIMVGIVTVVLMYRVNRAGWLAGLVPPAPPAEPAQP